MLFEIKMYASVSGFLFDVLTEADSIVTAAGDFLEACEELAGNHRAVAQLETDNYLKNNLKEGTLVLNKGDNRHHLDDQVKAGERSALTVKQYKPIQGGIEFVIHWTTANGREVIGIIVKAYQQFAFRKPTIIGLCIAPNHDDHINYDSYDLWNNKLCKDNQLDLSKLVKTLKCCGSGFCAMLSATGNHFQSNITLGVYPRKSSELEHTPPGLENDDLQEFLDDIADDQAESCYYDDKIYVNSANKTQLSFIAKLMILITIWKFIKWET